MSGAGITGIAGIDIGAGGIRVAVEARGAMARHDLSAALPLDGGGLAPDRLTALVAAAVQPPAAQLDVGSFTTVTIGLTGIPGRFDDPEGIARAIRSSLRLARLIIAGDAVTTHVGALALQPGTIVAAGTGVMALGTDLDRIWNRADGWGFLLGDEGGGAWIGAAGLRAALRAHDGRPGGSASLLELMRSDFCDPGEAVERIYRPGASASDLASFAPSVAAAARAGDAVAAGIWQDAAVRLGESAAAAATGLEPVFSWGGRLFDAGDILIRPFREEVRRRVAGARFSPPLGASVDGALLLSRTSATVHAHAPYVYVFDG